MKYGIIGIIVGIYFLIYARIYEKRLKEVTHEHLFRIRLNQYFAILAILVSIVIIVVNI